MNVINFPFCKSYTFSSHMPAIFFINGKEKSMWDWIFSHSIEKNFCGQFGMK